MTVWLWLTFLVVASSLIALDLLVLTRRPRAVTSAEGRTSVALWLLGTVAFSLLVLWLYQTDWRHVQEFAGVARPGRSLPGHIAWLHFVTCYALEIMLSLDNLAVLAALHVYYRLPRPVLARMLFWSILLALVSRLAMISGGAWLITSFAWFRWVLVGVLVLAIIRMFVLPDEHTDFDRKPMTRLFRRLIPFRPDLDGQKLLSRDPASGRMVGTPLLLVVLVGGVLDFAFAIDTVPALLSITPDPLIAFTASAFALLGLRSLYFALWGVIARMRFLRVGLVAILALILVKMILSALGMLPALDATVLPTIMLASAAGIMALAVWLSLRRERSLVRTGALPPRPTPIEDLGEVAFAARRNVRKIWILIAGTTVIIFGILIAPLPGPGPTILVPLGLGILATEFVWARRMLTSMKTGAFSIGDELDKIVDRAGIWLLPLLLVGWWVAAWEARLLIEDISLLFKSGGFQLGVWIWIMIFGSPFMPVMLWAISYVRRYFNRAGAPAVHRRPACAPSSLADTQAGVQPRHADPSREDSV